MARLLALTWIAFVFAGCASVGVTRVNDAPPRPESCDLDFYSDEGEVERPYEVVCLIDAQTSAGGFADRTIRGAVNKAKPKACKCGADALILVGGDKEGWVLGGQARALLRAVRYQDRSEEGQGEAQAHETVSRARLAYCLPRILPAR